MSLRHWGFIYTATGADPAGETTVADTGRCRTVLVGLPGPEGAPGIARRLVDEGAQLIELCGGFGPVWTAKVLEAVEHRVPVGSVAYGPESVTGVHEIFA
ncbi:DUF6506 family protein [Amycolatopsis sp. YIM 10]|uniref:DUF6506 family protein n=1 Tax=Amycolatopsis sp. YIM 10 TaxID=2653857 RepID=UPI00128FF7AE|nr:DUF6506 family protein [Amycolatopsis sp. YIM 10]QFU89456.1 hypothetical protein YIM_21385 [Amycolatopsis sp. YIM 10]